MFKATLLSSLIASSFAETQTLADVVSKVDQRTNVFKNKSFKLNVAQSKLSSTSNVAASSQGIAKMTSPVRTLRGGKSGKGKGKKDDSEGGGDDGKVTYLQISEGVCAGDDVGSGPVGEDYHWDITGFRLNSCTNYIEKDGSSTSAKHFVTTEPFAIKYHDYKDQGCVEDNYVGVVTDTQLTNDILGFAGGAFSNGVCNNGVTLSLTTTPDFGLSSSIVVGYSSDVANCRKSVESGSGFDLLHSEKLNWPKDVAGLPSGTPICHSDEEMPGMWYTHVADNCMNDPAELITKYYRDDACSDLDHTSFGQIEMLCFFDVESFYEDWTNVDEEASLEYASQSCIAV